MRKPPSQGGSAGSNPVGATGVTAGHRPDRRVRRSGLDHLSVSCPCVPTPSTGANWHQLPERVTRAAGIAAATRKGVARHRRLELGMGEGAAIAAGLYGRASELATIDEVVVDASSGRSRALVLQGPAGIGKSALLGYAAAAGTAAGVRVLRCRGVESEAELAFAALHQLLPSGLVDFEALPDSQLRVLRGALGMDSAAPDGDQLMVGLAVLSALSEIAGRRGVLCLID